MRCRLISPDETKELEVRSLTLTSELGRLTLLEHHAPLVSAIRPGALIIESDDRKKTTYQLTGGFLKVLDNQVTVLAEKFSLS